VLCVADTLEQMTDALAIVRVSQPREPHHGVDLHAVQAHAAHRPPQLVERVPVVVCQAAVVRGLEVAEPVLNVVLHGVPLRSGHTQSHVSSTEPGPMRRKWPLTCDDAGSRDWTRTS